MIFTQGSRTRDVGFFTFLVMILGLPTGVARAHGGGVPRLTNVEAGPYWVSVWSEPDPLRVGQAHISVAVSRPTEPGEGYREAGPPILDATVRVQFTALDHSGETMTGQATHKGAANKLFYETDLELPEVGRWQVEIAVEGPEGSGSATFEAQVAPPTAFNWTWIGGLGVVALAAVWVVRKFRDEKTAAD